MHGVSLHVVGALCDALGVAVDFTLRPPWLPDSLRPEAPARVVAISMQRDLVHARCTAYVTRRLRAHGWEVRQEVRIATGRSHGFIDLAGYHAPSRSLLVGEVKSELGDLGDLQRTIAWYLDEAGAIAQWQHRPVARRIAILFVLDSGVNDAFLWANADAVKQAFPVRGRHLAAWLADPSVMVAQARDGSGTTMGVAVIDPARRGRRWLIGTAVDGRTAPSTYADYRDAATRLRSKPRL